MRGFELRGRWMVCLTVDGSGHSGCRPMMGTTRLAFRTFLTVMLAAGLMVACSPIYSTHGFVPFDSDLEEVKVGRTTKAQIAEAIGQPAVKDDNFGDDWYFVASRFRARGLSRPTVIERDVVVVSFDKRGRVANLGRYNLSDGRIVELSRRVTAVKLGRLTILEQLSKAFGRVNVEDILDDR